MKYDSRIIHSPRSQPALQRGFFSIVTLFFWVAYAYLWLPLVTLVLWALGVRTALFELYLREHQIDTFVLFSLPLLALVSAALLIAWAEYNRWRFRSGDRRAAQPDVSRDEVARAFGSSAEIARALSTSKIAVLTMSDAAAPTAISTPAQGAA